MTDCADGLGRYDSVSDLCWEDPPNDTVFLSWYSAVDYCDELVLGGRDDWRMPMIQELISLIRGCVSGVPTVDSSPSSCGVTDPECLSPTCVAGPDCDWCTDHLGPDGNSGGCYWDPALSGICDAYYWSISEYATDANYHWSVWFFQAYVMSNAGLPPHVRCVADGE
jgi:hypothetical protein